MILPSRGIGGVCPSLFLPIPTFVLARQVTLPAITLDSSRWIRVAETALVFRDVLCL